MYESLQAGYIFVITFVISLALLGLMLLSLRNSAAPFWIYSIMGASVVYAYSYLRVGISNPGFAKPLAHVDENTRSNPRFCSECRTVRSHEVYHCYTCEVCIAGYDHHCPWIGKCVGEGNLCSFYFFLFMCFGTLILCLIATLSSNSSRH